MYDVNSLFNSKNKKKIFIQQEEKNVVWLYKLLEHESKIDHHEVIHV